jgi:hypothetical protein
MSAFMSEPSRIALCHSTMLASVSANCHLVCQSSFAFAFELSSFG